MAHGAIVLLAGLVISAIGMTSVFVQEDLEYLGLCDADLTAVGYDNLMHLAPAYGGLTLIRFAAAASRDYLCDL